MVLYDLFFENSSSDNSLDIDNSENIEEIELINQKEKDSFDFAITVKDGFDVRKEIFKVLSDNNMPIIYEKSSHLTLEEVFLHLTKEGAKPILSLEKKEDK